MIENILNKLNEKLNHDLDMDGFGNGYEAGLNEAIEIVKDCSIPDVTQQRELLIAFSKYVIDFDSDINGTAESIVDEYIKDNL